ncbi:hypothetical protein BSL82_15775 [Tardibacter chloracetimidivorans]|uniref:Uncharacterized protein n=1 Tax=Tardibacter chloracetimidivorans TaxID=1921510 RepID=A0A1L3ZV39_9SPHN|nr:hypothetical protein [Tardibacter chloracetimidivorans]API58110.1 hypothetical protein BSL82_01350 [Tardibacter chloracetimidivorans]API59502.1 hypothetical protein BSL82_09435 [Tardibacter chloracetimidivorans]API60564.1 hypothetical protein BSL82_15775 [Tardibacter chloracetimidivorans]
MTTEVKVTEADIAFAEMFRRGTGGGYDRDVSRMAHEAAKHRLAHHQADEATVERAVMVCPQCEGEGGYPDGADEDACHTECTRCGGNGWIVDTAAITAMWEDG